MGAGCACPLTAAHDLVQAPGPGLPGHKAAAAGHACPPCSGLAAGGLCGSTGVHCSGLHSCLALPRAAAAAAALACCPQSGRAMVGARGRPGAGGGRQLCGGPVCRPSQRRPRWRARWAQQASAAQPCSTKAGRPAPRGGHAGPWTAECAQACPGARRTLTCWRLYVGTAGLYTSLAALLAAGSAQACGLAQLLMHESRQITNRCCAGLQPALPAAQAQRLPASASGSLLQGEPAHPHALPPIPPAELCAAASCAAQTWTASACSCRSSRAS